MPRTTKAAEVYTDHHATSGISEVLPTLEVVNNQWPDHKYEVRLVLPEFTSLCPRTGLPDFGTITIIYYPHKHLVEMKSLKLYLQAYRDVGIFQENVVNRVLRDFVDIVKPTRCRVVGEFKPRGGMHSITEARYGE